MPILKPPSALRVLLAKVVGTKLDTLSRWWSQIRTIYHCFNLIRFNLLLGIICSVALYTGQGQDILRAMVEVEPWYDNPFANSRFLSLPHPSAGPPGILLGSCFCFAFPANRKQPFLPNRTRLFKV